MDYKYLRAWNKMLLSPTTFNVDQARKENAPQDAIYRVPGSDGQWVRCSDIQAAETREMIQQTVDEMAHNES